MKRVPAAVFLAALGAGLCSAQISSDDRVVETIRDLSHRMGHESVVVQSVESPDVTPYPVRGVDVSAYDGRIRWLQVKAAGISFAFIKATEGDTFVDSAFAANWEGAAGAGILEGAYHFYDFCDTGEAQAANFIKTVKPTPGALPMVLDLEESGSCARMPPKAVFLSDLAAFTAKIEATYGLKPLLYVNAGIYNEYLKDCPDVYRLWIADPTHASPAVPAGAAWTFWQYSWHGAMPGISTGSRTDLDAFHGDGLDLARLTTE